MILNLSITILQSIVFIFVLEFIRKFKDQCAWLGVAAIIIDMYKHFQRFGTQTNKMHNNLDSAWAARLSVNIIIFFFILHFWCRSQWAICIIFRNFEIIYWYSANIKLARYFEIMKILSHVRFYKQHHLIVFEKLLYSVYDFLQNFTISNSLSLYYSIDSSWFIMIIHNVFGF